MINVIAFINGLPLFNDPHPVVSFEGFGNNSLTLLPRAFIGTDSKRSCRHGSKSVKHSLKDRNDIERSYERHN